MKVTIYRLPEVPLEEFADRHGLEMEVRERSPEDYCDGHWTESVRFYAHFPRVEVKKGSFLEGCCGDGATPEEAIANYARRISEKWLVLDAFKPQRVDVRAPRLAYKGSGA